MWARALAVFWTVTLAAPMVWAQAAPPATDWPCFRGPTHDGISREPFTWPAAGPKLLWKVNVEAGHSSVAVAGDRVFTMGNTANVDTVYGLDAASGKTVWKRSYPCNARFPIKGYDGPAATPTVEGHRVFTFSRMGHATALDAATGAILWQRDVREDEKAQLPTWGFCGSPRVSRDLVILNAGPAGVALDKNTGKTVWSSGPGLAGYATPVLFEHQGRNVAAIYSGAALVVVEAATGKRIWETPWPQPIKLNAADPVVVGDLVFVSAGRKTGCALFKVGATPAEVYRHQNINTSWHTCVLWEGHLYGGEGGNPEGAGRSPNALRCLEFKTGQIKWEDPRPGFHGLIVVGGKLLVLTEMGELIAVEARPDGYKELGKAKIIEPKTFTAPAFAGGKVYARNTRGDLVCYDMR